MTTSAPHITSISPAQGPAGTLITLTGTGFAQVTSITAIDSAAGIRAVVVPNLQTDTQITFLAPVDMPGPIEIDLGFPDVVADVGAFTETAAPPPPSGNNGIFCYLADTKTPMPKPVIGLSFINQWSDVEPSAGVYDWSKITAELDYCTSTGKRGFERIMVGPHSPAWVMAEVPCVTITFKPGGPMPQQTVTMPIPWNPKRLSLVTAMITAFGAEFDGHPALARVGMPGCGWLGEFALPHPWTGWLSSAPLPDGCGPDVFTDAKFIAAWNEIVDAYAAAFKKTQLTLAHGTPGDAASFGKNQVADLAAISAHAAALPNKIAFQANGLNTGEQPNQTLIALGKLSGGGMGYQQWGGNNTAAEDHEMFATAIAAGAKYVEVYKTDCVNPLILPELLILAAGIAAE